MDTTAKKFLSNIEVTNYFPEEVLIDILPCRLNSIKNLFSAVVWTCRNKRIYCGILFINPSFFCFCFSYVVKVMTWSKFKVVYFDLLLPNPRSAKEKLFAFIKKVLFSEVDLFIFLQRDVSGYLEKYKIKHEKCTYVPFKANNYEQLEQFEVKDEGYLLACGASYRDYKLLAKALEFLYFPVKIVLPEQEQSAYHRSVIDEQDFGENVEIIRHDFDRDTWYGYLANCRCVVLPIRPDVIQCAGISVCLEAMAFGKPVVISEGPATRQILTNTMAGIFPPGDHRQLAQIIQNIWEDEGYRQKLSRTGQAYALSLGGEERLVKDISRALLEV